MPELHLSMPIPYICQYASRDLVWELVYGEIALEEDPAWPDYGAVSPEEYAHWARRSCGVVCVKMAVEGLTGAPTGTIMEWVRSGLARGGYLTETRPEAPDRVVEKGWRHDALAQLAGDHGLQAELVSEVTLDRIADFIYYDWLLIASVTAELGEDGPITWNAGHLVVVHGVDLDAADQVIGVWLHNPSGRTYALQEDAYIPADRFEQGFSGRGIAIGRQRRTGTAPRLRR